LFLDREDRLKNQLPTHKSVFFSSHFWGHTSNLASIIWKAI
jgi:hypothetical protein